MHCVRIDGQDCRGCNLGPSKSFVVACKSISPPSRIDFTNEAITIRQQLPFGLDAFFADAHLAHFDVRMSPITFDSHYAYGPPVIGVRPLQTKILLPSFTTVAVTFSPRQGYLSLFKF